jgi:hypothetical protein
MPRPASAARLRRIIDAKAVVAGRIDAEPLARLNVARNVEQRLRVAGIAVRLDGPTKILAGREWRP